MNNHGKLLYSTKVDGMKWGKDDIHVGVYGIFRSDPGKGHWRYYLISFGKDATGQITKFTSEWMGYYCDATMENVSRHAKEISTVEDGIKVCDDYKAKWTSGSNNTTQQKRDEKLQEILK